MRRESKNEFAWSTQEVVNTLMKQARSKYKNIPEDATVEFQFKIDSKDREWVILKLGEMDD